MNRTQLPLYLTAPHPCSYLAGQEAITAFVDPQIPLDVPLSSRLAELGFRRSGPHVYRPQCANCDACIPVRIPVREFMPNRSQKRCWQRNHDVTIRLLDRIDSDRFYALYEFYLSQRHQDGDMYPPSREQFEQFLCVDWPGSFYLGFFLDERLIGVSVCDGFDNGLSAVYTFYDPTEVSRSLGAFAILSQISYTQQLGLDYLYLGYWISNSPKMRYKSAYRPLQQRLNGLWVPLDWTSG